VIREANWVPGGSPVAEPKLIPRLHMGLMLLLARVTNLRLTTLRCPGTASLEPLWWGPHLKKSIPS